MSIFHWLSGSKTEPDLSPDLIRRLEAIDERQREQDRTLKQLELDWTEWFDKFRLLYARLAKRIRDAGHADENGAQSREDAPRPTIDAGPLVGPAQQIERRRTHVGGNY